MKTLEANLAASLEGFRTDMAQRDKENARWPFIIGGSLVGVIALATTILGVLIRLPAPPV